MCLFKDLPQNLPEGTEKNGGNLRIVIVTVEIQTWCLPNESFNHYCLCQLPCSKCFALY
jgi:hypothetical protein